MKVFEQAYAKINLYLDVSQKRDDGYHDLTTVMHQITLFDELYIEACDAQQIQITLEIDGGDAIPCDCRNLVYRAIDLLLNELQRPMQVHVKIIKRIPSMADSALFWATVRPVIFRPVTSILFSQAKRISKTPSCLIIYRYIFFQIIFSSLQY